MWRDKRLRCSVLSALRSLVFASFLIGSLAACAPRTGIPSELGARLVASGFASPDEVVAPPDHSGRLFVVDQVGLIWILSGGKRLDKPFLDIRDRIVELMPFYDERGLLGLAFHPQFATNGLFYLYYSAPLRPGLSSDAWDHTTRVSEFKVSSQDANLADASSERILLSIDKPGYNDEGGGLAFGPDGYLYIGTGDSIHDPATHAGQYAQDTYSLLGKILRVDVNTDDTGVNTTSATLQYHIPPGNPFIHGGGSPEVFAYGFRNPYRLTFDQGPSASTMRLIVTDVGQAVMEEADVVVSGGNYGWPVREGTTCFNPRQWNQPLPRCASAGLVDPVLEYPHAGKASAIIGGVVYRGTALHGLYGDFVFGDWGRGIQSLFAAVPQPDESGQWPIQRMRVVIPGSQGGQLLGLGVDENHELYMLAKDPGIGPVGNTGRVYQIVWP